MPRPSPQLAAWMREDEAREKSAPPMGGYTAGWGGGPWWTDAFRSRRAPTPVELTELYKSLVYACVTLNANGVARQPLRLFAVTRTGEARPKCATKSVGHAARKRLATLPYAAKTMAGAAEVEEVTDHPLLDLLQHVNEEMDHAQLIAYTVMSLDIVGSAYWWPSPGSGGVPEDLWALPPHLVFPQWTSGSLIPDAYQFGGVQYERRDLIRFRRLSARNPYGQGYGPEQASIEYARLEDTFVSIQDDMLSNGPRPSIIVSPKDEKGSFGDAEAERLEHKLNRKTRGGRSGSAVVARGPVSMAPVDWKPADLGGLQISSYDMERIANCFDVPVSMLKTEDVNRANAEAGQEQHARNGVEPRCKLIASALTRWTHQQGRQGPRDLGNRGWDRLLWAFDPAVKEDQEAEQKRHTAYVAMGLPPNVALTEAGYEAVEGGDVSYLPTSLQPMGTTPTPEPEKPGTGNSPMGDTGETEDEDETGENSPKGDTEDESKALASIETKTLQIERAATLLAEVRKSQRSRKPRKPRGGGKPAGHGGGHGEGNPNHDEHGRFSSGPGAGGGGKPKPGHRPSRFHTPEHGPGVDRKLAIDRAAAKAEEGMAKALGGRHVGDYDALRNKRKPPYDIHFPAAKSPSGRNEYLEVKYKSEGKKNALSVHADALLRKADHQAEDPKSGFGTVLIDVRDRSFGGTEAGHYQGHDLYYKRGAGAYTTANMYRVKDMAELKRLIATPDHELPELARGTMPKRTPELEAQAEKVNASRARRDDNGKKQARRQRYNERKRAGLLGTAVAASPA